MEWSGVVGSGQCSAVEWSRRVECRGVEWSGQ